MEEAVISVAVMAHPSRRKFVDLLFLGLDSPASVVWDQRNDRWDTGRRALLAHDPAADYHLVVQDDAVPCLDFVAGAERAAMVAGERPVGLYVGRTRPHRELVTPAIEQALEAGFTWFEHEGPWWGVAIVVPTAHIEELVEWGDGRGDIPNYDRRISRYYYEQEIKCWYTLPSLVDHRPVDENPSLVKGRTGNRQAHQFIGKDRSALEIEWGTEPFRVPDGMVFA